MAAGTEAEWAVPPLFVYGLLRPGQRHWAELAPAVRRRRPARVRGALYLHVPGAYPRLDLDGDGWVAGDLLDVDDTPTVRALVCMELSAGYEARWTAVYARRSDERYGPAITFAWPWGEDHRGPPIPTGDWLRR
jgi:gamma-glutamylcyclotransferase (GGCT)/AIG2-like uncharacterized protein YtfP